MGYNFKYGNSRPSHLDFFGIDEDPVVAAARHLNASEIRNLQPPAMRGSEKQIEWAIRLFDSERYFWHGAGYKAPDIKLFLTTPEALSASWWITTCKDNHNGMGGNMRIALDAILARIKQPTPTPASLSLKLKVGYPDRKVA